MVSSPYCTGVHTHYWIQALCRVPNALGKGYFALGKAFAEGSTRQRAFGKKSVGKEFFAERLLSDTQQSLCRVQSRKVTITAPVALAHALPSAMSEALDKDFLFFFQNFFAERPTGEALGKDFFLIISLPSALPGRRSANIFKFFFS